MSTWSANLTTAAQRGTAKHHIDPAPAPWTLSAATSYTFLFSVNPSNLPVIEPHLTTPTDKVDLLPTGLGGVMIIRYDNSPVGAYDELIFVAPFKSRPRKNDIDPGEKRLAEARRLPRIYVSSEASLRNGRVNWGIRKELADFEFMRDEKHCSALFDATRVVVKDRLTGNLIMDVTVRQMKGWGVPVSTKMFWKYMPSLEERAINEEGEAITDEVWLHTTPSAWGWSKAANLVCVHGVDQAENYFPDVGKLGLYSLGAHFKGTFMFPEAVRRLAAGVELKAKI
ncbi:hypothetical protein HK104_008982 [Borealophlyctis nickersoniae]|nr:hypothetical protein HK104_008982 [Borealophlyctis nickersoniae]